MVAGTCCVRVPFLCHETTAAAAGDNKSQSNTVKPLAAALLPRPERPSQHTKWYTPLTLIIILANYKTLLVQHDNRSVRFDSESHATGKIPARSSGNRDSRPETGILSRTFYIGTVYTGQHKDCRLELMQWRGAIYYEQRNHKRSVEN